MSATTFRFRCPACFRNTHRITASDVATEVFDRKCPACGVRWRFVVTPVALAVAGETAVAHVVRNTALLTPPKPPENRPPAV